MGDDYRNLTDDELRNLASDRGVSDVEHLSRLQLLYRARGGRGPIIFAPVFYFFKWILSERYQEWKAARQERKIVKLTAKAAKLNEDEEYDLLFLNKKGFVRAKATGQSITDIYADVESLMRKKLRVVIKPGTYFVATGNHQNMVTKREYSFTLYPLDTENIAVGAACINADLPIPEKTDSFYGVKKVSSDLSKFLEASTHEDSMTVQAGVWALTDNYSGNDVKERLVSKDQYGNIYHAVSDYNIEQARSILNKLKIRHNL